MSDNSAAEARVETEPPVQLPLLSAPRNPRVTYVETEDELFEAVRELAAASGPFAVDAERASGFKYSQRAYLVQLMRVGSPIFLIDPIGLAGTPAMESLASCLSTDEWILHAATQDLPCLAELGLRPTALFDTELGSRLASLERVGLGAVVEKFLGVRLAKEHSAADWSVRPLNSDWLNYAALDVDVLHDVRAGLAELLRDQGKAEIAAEEFQHLLSFRPKPAKADRWRGVSGIHTIKDQRTLAIIRELWTRREQVAERVDVSPGRLIPDHSIVAAAKANPRSRSELAGLKDFNGRGSRTFIDEWWAAIQQGATTRDLPAARAESSGIPHHKSWAQRFPEADARLKAVRERLEQLAKETALPVENLVSPDPIRQLCFSPAGFDANAVTSQLASLGVRRWQIEIIVDAVVEAIAPTS